MDGIRTMSQFTTMSYDNANPRLHSLHNQSCMDEVLAMISKIAPCLWSRMQQSFRLRSDVHKSILGSELVSECWRWYVCCASLGVITPRQKMHIPCRSTESVVKCTISAYQAITSLQVWHKARPAIDHKTRTNTFGFSKIDCFSLLPKHRRKFAPECLPKGMKQSVLPMLEIIIMSSS